MGRVACGEVGREGDDGGHFEVLEHPLVFGCRRPHDPEVFGALENAAHLLGLRTPSRTTRAAGLRPTAPAATKITSMKANAGSTLAEIATGRRIQTPRSLAMIARIAIRV